MSGFDRLVFRGTLRSLNFSEHDASVGGSAACGMERHLRMNGVPFKDYRDHVKGVSGRVKAASEKPFRDAGRPVEFVRSPKLDKDSRARELAGEGAGPLGCALGAMEPSPSYEQCRTRMAHRTRLCPVVYHYGVHPLVGWMYARLHLWFPFDIQVGINGREWATRQMDREGML